MKIESYLGRLLLFALLALLQGCGNDKSDYKPLSGGFLFASTWVGVDSGPGAEIYYKGEQSKPIVIWPFVKGGLAYTNDLIFFYGDMPDNEGRLGAGTYFAAQAPGPALEISKDVLRIWASSNNLDLNKPSIHYRPFDAAATKNGIQVYYGIEENLQQRAAKFMVSWEQLSNIIQGVKQTGTRHVIEYSPRKLKVTYLKNDPVETN